MGTSVRQRIEDEERSRLSPYAQLAAESRGRQKHEEPDSLRTCFMRDRDRILHSKPFRRLKYKTQVFISPQGDHYRTRMTHSLEVAQIARTISRALRLNEDLTEAIALGHDVGHTPFGHVGEEALDEALNNVASERRQPDFPLGFRHHEQSLRVWTVLTPSNLTFETLEGIGGHSKGRSDFSADESSHCTTLEAASVRISDRIAYLNHDLDDAIRGGFVTQIPDQFESLGSTHGQRISAMVQDIVEQSLEKPKILMSESMLATLNSLKEWLFENVYHKYPEILPQTLQAKKLVQALFTHFCKDNALPPGFYGIQGAVDYVSGMTDRFAVRTFENIFVPVGFAEGP